MVLRSEGRVCGREREERGTERERERERERGRERGGKKYKESDYEG
jgi:hypothetical protein